MKMKKEKNKLQFMKLTKNNIQLTQWALTMHQVNPNQNHPNHNVSCHTITNEIFNFISTPYGITNVIISFRDVCSFLP